MRDKQYKLRIENNIEFVSKYDTITILTKEKYILLLLSCQTKIYFDVGCNVYAMQP